MTNPYDPFYPVVPGVNQKHEVYSGISIREHFTLEMAKILAKAQNGSVQTVQLQEQIAKQSVALADRLINALNTTA